MDQALFESLTGEFSDGTPLESVPKSSRTMRSIMDHLNRMFNTREGTLPHLTDYGLPDISEIYRKMPDGIDMLQSALNRAVERYEPRLTRVKVTHSPNEQDKFRLVFIVSGQLISGGGLVEFQTTFTSQGNSSIAPWKRPV